MIYLHTKLHRQREEQVICRKSFPPRARKSNPSQHVVLKACSQSLKRMHPLSLSPPRLQALFLPFVQEREEKTPSERTGYTLEDVERSRWLTFSTIMQLSPFINVSKCGWLVVCQFSLATWVYLASLVTALETGQDVLPLKADESLRCENCYPGNDTFLIYLKISICKTTPQLSHLSGIWGYYGS